MLYNDHSNLEGAHALLAPSSPAWLNYDSDIAKERLYQKYKSYWAQALGTALHEYAAKRISNFLKVPKTKDGQKEVKNSILMHIKDCGIPKNAIDMEYVFYNFMSYVNDAIGFKMDTEVLLYYSEVCFGTADALCFRNNKLRIHDYKSGSTPVHMEQLETYAALFCLEYDENPEDIETELRIYQSNNVMIYNPESSVIRNIMDTIIFSSEFMNELAKE